MSDEADFYEVLPHILDETGETELAASFTPNNGIRIGIAVREEDGEGGYTDWEGWYDFDFNDEQAEQIGQALVRWAQRSRAEGELIRCGMKVKLPPAVPVPSGPARY